MSEKQAGFVQSISDAIYDTISPVFHIREHNGVIDYIKVIYGEYPTTPDPVTSKLLFMRGTIQPLMIFLGCFLAFVYFIGPYIMCNRQPMNVLKTLKIHNAFLVTANGVIAIILATSLLLMRKKYSLGCEPVHRQAAKVHDVISYAMYAFLLLKVVELFDIMYLVVKKVTPPFIMVFHHTTILAVLWYIVKYGPGGSATFPVCINAFVHVMIYLHFKYVKESLTPGVSKRIFISIYIIQFLVVCGLASTCIRRNCGYPRWIALMVLMYNLMLLVLYSKTLFLLVCKPSIPPTGGAGTYDHEDNESSRKIGSSSAIFRRR